VLARLGRRWVRYDDLRAALHRQAWTNPRTVEALVKVASTQAPLVRAALSSDRANLVR
jgi:hypothetical protein